MVNKDSLTKRYRLRSTSSLVSSRRRKKFFIWFLIKNPCHTLPMHDLPLKRPTYRGRSRNTTPHFPSFVRSEHKLNIAWLPVRCNSYNSDTVYIRPYLTIFFKEDRVYQSPSLKAHMSSWIVSKTSTQ
ncbi:hypothetical protein FVEG_15431 [Fusarium verticillioides 7600]|uniref:Uncharacterized protein n=1 Tax=Gibberella moniliformis (strain M3125 / FGSC 7600) TaxID=334819 RepID=W7M4E2_GIBM7|nr:hypothetical protein FVEG_15431 [Fusarium verticillioides 7600]EWG42415.1 hypothetical protein FVEG_15431 [Fusarium verticillioides 7600]